MLEHLGMVGISWRRGSTESLGGFKLPESQLDERLQAFAQAHALDELAYIATCNRVEIMFVRSADTGSADLRPHVFRLLAGRDAEHGEAERRQRAWQGEGAAEHLFLIAAGLDSVCVGEPEIVGQVRSSLERSTEFGLIGPGLKLVFDEALRIAARVRGETRLGEGRVSLAEIALEHVRERITATPGKVALIGVAPMTERAAVSLHADIPLIVVNRTLAKAQTLAARFGAEAMSLDGFCAEPPPVEVLVCSTGSPEPVLREAALERIVAKTPSGRAPLIVDMAVPADVDPAICRKLAIPRIGMDEIVARAEGNRGARLVEAAQAREQVDAALDKLQERIAERYFGPLLGALQQRFQRTAREGVNRLLKKELKGLGQQERAAIETWSEVLARRFAHIPCLGLRGLLYTGPDGSVEAFLSGLEPEFADELRAALQRKSGIAENRL